MAGISKIVRASSFIFFLLFYLLLFFSKGVSFSLTSTVTLYSTLSSNVEFWFDL